MSVTDPIGDMLTRIRNANQIMSKTVDITLSKLNLEIARVLKEQGYIEDYEVKPSGKFEIIQVNMKYVGKKKRAISGLKRISKPGLRVYAKRDEISKVLGGLGIAIISTSKGVLTDGQARQSKSGGEVIAFVW